MKACSVKGKGERFFERIGGEDFFVSQEHLYLACPLDPQIHAELRVHEPWNTEAQAFEKREPKPKIVFHEGVAYVETVSWNSLIQHAEILFPHTAQKIRKQSVRDFRIRPKWLGRHPCLEHVEMVVLQVLPRFVRVPRSVKGAKDRPAALAAWLAKRVSLPIRYRRWAEEMEHEKKGVSAKGFDGLQEARDGDGPRRVSVQELREAVEAALTGRYRDSVLKEESRLRERMQHFGHWPTEARAFMLYVFTRGALEVDGFGFFHRAFDGALIVYKRTGRYALMDYYHRLYLFPDCRVAVSPLDLWPVVVEKYKHPLLARHQPWQRICLGHAPQERSWTAANIFRSIEDGLNALYYGYDARKRNGYHSLDQLSGSDREVHFEDLRISADDTSRLLKNIPVTNAWT
ncbi:MAG: hypothetical protein WHS46_09760 [Desulfosoma sp.]